MPTTINDLKEIRDEIKLKLHLAGMDAKKQWQALEPRLADLERRFERGTDKVAEAAVDLIDELADAFKSFRDRLGSS